MWNPGAWRNLGELQTVVSVVQRYENAAGGEAAVRGILGGMSISRISQGTTQQQFNTVYIADYTFDQPNAKGPLQKLWGPRVSIAHEFAHYWDWTTGDLVSKILEPFGARGQLSSGLLSAAAGEEGPTVYARTGPYGEDWAESVAGYLYPEYFDFLAKEQSGTESGAAVTLVGENQGIPSFDIFSLPGLGTNHRNYVAAQFQALQVFTPRFEAR